MQPVGLPKGPLGRGCLRTRLRRRDAKTAGISNKPVVMMTGLEQPGPSRQHLGCKEELSRKKNKTRPKIWPNYYTVGPNLGGYTQWVR